MSRRLILLRHGLTAWNAELRWQGQADIELTETGRLQAKRVAAAVAAVEPVLVVSSDLARAAETARIVADGVGLTPSYDPRLREINVGRLSGMTKDEVAVEFGPGPHEYADFGGESEQQVRARTRPALEETVSALADGESALVVGHGASLRIAVCDLLGWPLGSAVTLGALDNCGWLELATGLTGWHGDAPWKLIAYNRVAGS